MTKAEERRMFLQQQAQPQTQNTTTSKADLRRLQLQQPTELVAQSATQPVVQQPVVTQLVQQTQQVQPQVTSHAQKAQQGYTQAKDKLHETEVKGTPMTDKINSGASLTPEEVIQLAKEQGKITSEEAQYQNKLAQARKTPTVNNYANKANYENVPVKSTQKEQGKKDAEKVNVTSENAADEYIKARANLQQAKANNDTREIAKNEAIVEKSKQAYNGEKPNIDITSLGKQLNGLEADLDKIQSDYNLTTDIELKNRLADDYNKTLENYNAKRKIYNNAVAYDEIKNNNMANDIAGSTYWGLAGGTHRMGEGAYALGSRLSNANADQINADELLRYNNNEANWTDTVQDIGNALGKLNLQQLPVNLANRLLGNEKQTANSAYTQLQRVALLNPDNIGIQRLYRDITNHTYKGTAEDLRNELDKIQKELYQNYRDVTGADYVLGKEREQLAHNENVYGELAAIPNAFNTTANMIPSMALAPLGGENVSLAAMAVGAGGGALDEALEAGARYNQGFNYGVLSGATEFGTEKLFGSGIQRAIGINGTIDPSELANKFADSLGIKNKIGRAVLQTMGDVTGESLEEMISETLNPLWKYATYDQNAFKEFNPEQIIKAGIDAIPSTLLMEGMGAAGTSVKVDLIANGVVKSINQSKDLSPIVKNQLINEVREAAKDVKLGLQEEGYIGTRTNEKLENLTASSNDMKARIPQGYTLPQSTVDTLSFMENYRPGLNIAFDTNIQGNGTFVENPDGTRTITLNPNSKRAVEFTLTHELGHDLKGTQEYTQLQNLLTDYAKGKPGYQEALKQLDKTYKESGANYNLQDEATNDMLGQAIGEQEFYNKLAENPTLFNRVTNGLKNLLGNKDTKLKNKIEKLTSNALKQEYREAAQDVLFSKQNASWQQFLDNNLNWANGTKTKFEGLPSSEQLQNNGVNEILKDLNLPSNEELQKAETKTIENEPIVNANKIAENKKLEDMRNFKEVGNRKVNAYQYENPEVKPFFQYEAGILLDDLNNAIKGERFWQTGNGVGDGYGADSYYKVTGQKRDVVQDIADLLDGNYGVKLSYNDIRKGLEAIIEDNGAENIAAAKRIEMVLDKRLREGYKDSYGYYHEPGENYNKFLRGEEYVAPDEYDLKQLQDTYDKKDDTLFSLSDEETKEINDYIGKLNNDTTIDENFKEQVLNKFDNLNTYKQFEDIKKEVQDYKDRTYKGISGLVDIANMKEEDVKQQPMQYTQKVDKNTSNQRKFFENAETSPIIAEQTKNRVNATTYEQKANSKTLEEVRQKLDERGNDLVDEWKMKSKNFTDKDVALGAILIERYQQNGDWESAARAVEKLADIGTEAGRAVQMYSIFQRLSPETMAIYQQKALDKAFEDMKKNKTGKWVEANKDKFKLTAEDTQFIHDQVEKASQAIDEETKQRELSKIENRINGKLPPNSGDAIKTLRRIAMLFNPKTQVRNVVGNALIMPVNDVADLVGTAIDKIISNKTNVRTTSTPNLVTKAKGFGKGIKDAITDYKTGTRTTATGSKYEFEFGAKPFNENTNSKARNAINHKLNWINDLLSAVMSGGDRPFYEAAYKNSLEGQMKANKVSEPTQEMIDIAVNEALQRTWNDSNKYTETVLKIRKAMNTANIRGFGLGDLIIPFAKTPANLTKAMVEYSPAGFIESVLDFNDMRKAISRGEMTPQQQKKFVTSMSKAITGTILYLIAGTLAKGIRLPGSDDEITITGSADDDKDVRNFEQNVMGIQPYSVRIGDKTYTYSWANPINFPLAVMADNYKMSKENASLWDRLSNGFKVAGETLVDNSFLSGIKELFGSDSISEGLVKSVESFPESLVPTLLSQIASLGDDKQRQTYEYQNELGTVGNRIKNKIPGARNTLEPQVNAFGEEIENQNTASNAFLNPANVREARTTDTQNALYDLYQETKDKTIFPDVAPSYTNTGDGEKMNLSSKDKVTYSKASGQYITDVYGGLFNSDAFDTFKTTTNNNEGKVKILQKVKEDANLKGREAVGAISEDNSEKLSKLNERLKKLDNAGIPYEDYYIMWYYVNNGEDKKNNTKKNGIGEVIRNLDHDISSKQKDVLYGIFDISKGSK